MAHCRDKDTGWWCFWGSTTGVSPPGSHHFLIQDLAPPNSLWVAPVLGRNKSSNEQGWRHCPHQLADRLHKGFLSPQLPTANTAFNMALPTKDDSQVHQPMGRDQFFPTRRPAQAPWAGFIHHRQKAEAKRTTACGRETEITERQSGIPEFVPDKGTREDPRTVTKWK